MTQKIPTCQECGGKINVGKSISWCCLCGMAVNPENGKVTRNKKGKTDIVVHGL